MISTLTHCGTGFAVKQTISEFKKILLKTKTLQKQNGNILQPNKLTPKSKISLNNKKVYD